MNHPFYFQKITDTSTLNLLKSEWRKTLISPQDGMWETLTDLAEHWEVRDKDQSIGYVCVDMDNQLLQFYVRPNWLKEGNLIFQEFIQQKDIKKALIGTNNPVCLSIAMHFQKSLQVHTYLFTDFFAVHLEEGVGILKVVKEEDLINLVDFYHKSTGGPKDWLTRYLSNLMKKGEVFMLENEAEILGTCEVRKSTTNPKVADIGMIVSPTHRKKGLGTFLLGKAKAIAIQWEKTPICSCEKDNIGSLKSIQNNGFRSIHQMLSIEF